MEEERRKLIFLWEECHPEKTGSESILDKTFQKIRDNTQPNVLHSRPALTPTRILNIAESIRQTLPATLAMKENLFYTDSIP